MVASTLLWNECGGWIQVHLCLQPNCEGSQFEEQLWDELLSIKELTLGDSRQLQSNDE